MRMHKGLKKQIGDIIGVASWKNIYYLEF
jgi:hypothetical protein